MTIEELYKIGYFSGLDFHFARTMGRLAGERNPLALLAAALVSRWTRQGHVCLDLGALAGKPLIADTGETLADGRWPDIREWLRALSESRLLARCDAVAPLVIDEGDRLYLARYWQYQQRLVFQLRSRASVEASGVDRPLLERGLERFFPGGEGDEPDGQRTATETSVLRHLTVVSGGPGTGKTFTVVRMLQLIIDQALSAGKPVPRILLAAPTGKAAARLKASVAAAKASATAEGDVPVRRLMDLIPDEAGTIHRLLGSNAGDAFGGSKRAGSYLPVDVLVVDEASMVDLSLMARLMEAAPPDARVVLLGDRDQLASVEAGAILGDICRGASGAGNVDGEGRGIGACVVTLTRSYRFDAGGGIGALADAIRRGDSRKALACLEEKSAAGVIFKAMPEVSALPRLLEEMSREAYLPYFREKDPVRKTALFNTFRILCAHRKGPVGVDRVNELVARLLLSETGMAPERLWYPGRPVMVTRNDYPLHLFNGDVGIVVPGSRGSEDIAVYLEETKGAGRMIQPSRMPPHDTVYAMTVHKSQGSEFDRIVLVLPPRRSPVVTRELLYTAVTRARKNVTILGTRQVIREAVETPVQRASGLSEQLIAKGQNAAPIIP